MKQVVHGKTKIISKILLSLSSAFLFVSGITQVDGNSPAIPPPRPRPVINIYSTGHVTRGETGGFILFISPCSLGGTYVNFSVSGSAIPGVDYVPLVSPVCIGCGEGPEDWCGGLLSVRTFPDPRGSFIPQEYDVVVKLEPGLGYEVGQPNSARLIIEP